MTQPETSNPTLLSRQAIAVINPQYCQQQHHLDLFVIRKRKLKNSADVKCTIADELGNSVFKVKPLLSNGFHKSLLLVDGSDNTLITIRPKIRTAHKRHDVFRGNSSDERDLLFTVKKSSMIHNRIYGLDVILSQNTCRGQVDTFRIEGSWLERTCAVYLGESTDILAQMHKENGIRNKETDGFTVTVRPYVDYAFVIALIVIRGEINDTN